MQSLERLWSWVGAVALMAYGTGSALAQGPGSINITDNSGNYAGTLYVGGGGLDFSQSIGCPINPNSSAAQLSLIGMQFQDTNDEYLPLYQTSAFIYLDYDAYETGGCPDPALTTFTIAGPGYSLDVTPLPDYSSDSNGWTGTGIMSLTTASPLPPSPVTGFIKPKYIVLGMYYAPPGQKSNVQYGTSFVNGTVTSTSGSFITNVSQTASLTIGAKVKTPAAGASWSLTAAASGAWGQTTTDSKTVTISQTQTTNYTVAGPSSSKDGIDHGEDIVWVWVNPEVNFSFVQNVGATINGYFYDPSDPTAGMDVLFLTINELQNPSTIPTAELPRINRTWDTVGGPLTASDFADIANTDPYVANPAYNPETDPSARFTDTGVLINYEPTDGTGQGQASTQSYSVSTSKLTATLHSQTDSHTVGFSVDQKYSGSLFGLGASYDFKSSYSYEQTNTSSNTVNSQTGQTATATIVSPLYTDGYTGPTAIKIYRDEVYGTYMFYGAE